MNSKKPQPQVSSSTNGRSKANILFEVPSQIDDALRGEELPLAPRAKLYAAA